MTFLIVYLLIALGICYSLDGDHPIADMIVSLFWPLSIAYVVWEDYKEKKHKKGESE